jgi:hypothetical protein
LAKQGLLRFVNFCHADDLTSRLSQLPALSGLRPTTTYDLCEDRRREREQKESRSLRLQQGDGGCSRAYNRELQTLVRTYLLSKATDLYNRTYLLMRGPKRAAATPPPLQPHHQHSQIRQQQQQQQRRQHASPATYIPQTLHVNIGQSWQSKVSTQDPPCRPPRRQQPAPQALSGAGPTKLGTGYHANSKLPPIIFVLFVLCYAIASSSKQVVISCPVCILSRTPLSFQPNTV